MPIHKDFIYNTHFLEEDQHKKNNIEKPHGFLSIKFIVRIDESAN